MSIALPLIGVLLAALAVYFSTREPGEPETDAVSLLPRLLGAGVLLLVLLGIAFLYGPELDRAWIAVGAILGALAVSLHGKTGGLRLSALLGLAAGTCVHLLPAEGVPACQLALIAAAGIVSVVTGGYGAAVAATAVVALDRFGKLAGASENLAFAGSLVALSILLAAVFQQVLPKKNEYEVGFTFAFPLFAFLLLGNWLKDPMLAACGVLGLVGGAVIAALLPATQTAKPVSSGIAALISVGLATAGFALGRGTGMAAALLGAAGLLLVLGNGRALIALGPLFALVLFRLFRNIYPETSRAFDIGQHYALIGLLIGGIVPLIVIDAGAASEKVGKKGVAASVLIAIVVMALAPVLTVFLGPTGAVGLVVGLGFAGVFELVRQGSSALALSAGAGMGGVMLLTYGWLAQSLDLTRDEKIRMLAWAIGGILLISLVAGLLLRDGLLKEKE